MSSKWSQYTHTTKGDLIDGVKLMFEQATN